jgi:hypothetical protein
MRTFTDSHRARPITSQPSEYEPVPPHQALLRRVTGLIHLGVSLLNGLFVLRYIVELLDANPTTPFAHLVRAATDPFLAVFQGLTRSPAFAEVAFELHLLLAVTVYSLLGWAAAKLLRILFAGR